MRVDKRKDLRPSIFDRLIDNEPNLNVEPDRDKYQKLKQLRQSVRRDLENLLNTRYRIVKPPEELSELEHSILNYGLPDLATVNVQDVNMRKDFTKSLEKILKKYEPRFKSVRVSYLDNHKKTDRTLRFRIDATLYADPAPEVVVFDSTLEPVSRTMNVEEARHG